MSERTYLIHELAEKTGVSLRTIRFYIEKGLLPEAPIKGRYAAYSEEYVLRIELIKWLKQIRMPLDEIRERIKDLTDKQVQDYLNKRDEEQQRGRKQRKDQQAALPGIDDDEKLVQAIKSYLNGETLPAGMKPKLCGSIWERIEITDGIELHFRRPLNPQQHRTVQALIEFARRKFDDHE